MHKFFVKKSDGFTLIEMMLVAVIIGMFFVMMMGYYRERTRAAMVDRASQQMQQILNAGLSYYISHGDWPAAITDLQNPAAPYIPVGASINSPWGTPYSAGPVPPVPPSTNSILFSVTLTLPAALVHRSVIGKIIAGKLPYGVSTDGVNTTVTATVNLPGQNVNNATAVNFSGIFHHGACIPVPACPPTAANGRPMVPEVFVAPISVSGTAEANSNKVYPISSMTAYTTNPATTPVACTATGAANACQGQSATGLFWRACLRIITSRGEVQLDAVTAEYAQVQATTRCSVQGERQATLIRSGDLKRFS